MINTGMGAADRDMGTARNTVHRHRDEFVSAPISAAITPRGKELAVGDSVGAARILFACHPVRALPVLDGATYVGAVVKGSIADSVPDEEPIRQFVGDPLPTVVRHLPAPEALDLLDRSGERRLVVLEPDRKTYVGLVCMRGDRRRLCVAANGSDHGTERLADQLVT